MAEDTTLQVIERQQWVEPVADSVQKAVGAAYESTGEVGRRVKNALHGTWLGHPLHAALTDIPIGAWTATFVMDAMDEITERRVFSRGAELSLAVGMAGAAVSALAGVTDWQATDGRARKTGLIHGMLNLSATLLYGTSYVLRKQRKRSAARGLAFLGFGISMASAWLGGKLVYEERLGVDHSRDQAPPTEFTPVENGTGLSEGEMRRVEAAGARVLVTRCGGRTCAIGEVCSHLGGPLAEGKLENGVVQCPWHGSRFSVEDGHVVDGPAVHQQPTYDVRERDGRLEVRVKA